MVVVVVPLLGMLPLLLLLLVTIVTAVLLVLVEALGAVVLMLADWLLLLLWEMLGSMVCEVLTPPALPPCEGVAYGDDNTCVVRGIQR